MLVCMCVFSINRLLLTAATASLGSIHASDSICNNNKKNKQRVCVCVTMTGGGHIGFFTLLCCDATCSPVSLAVPGAMSLVVTMALPGHPNPYKQSPVA